MTNEEIKYKCNQYWEKSLDTRYSCQKKKYIFLKRLDYIECKVIRD